MDEDELTQTLDENEGSDTTSDGGDIDDDSTDEIPTGPVGYLKVFSQKGFPETVFPIHKGLNVIGRDRNCKISIPIKAVSKEHGGIEVEGNCFYIYDKRSTNKTSRVGQYLRPEIRYELRHNDELCFGDVRCVFLQHKQQQQQNIIDDDSSNSESLIRKVDDNDRLQQSATLVGVVDDESISSERGWLVETQNYNMSMSEELEPTQHYDLIEDEDDRIDVDEDDRIEFNVTTTGITTNNSGLTEEHRILEQLAGETNSSQESLSTMSTVHILPSADSIDLSSTSLPDTLPVSTQGCTPSTLDHNVSSIDNDTDDNRKQQQQQPHCSVNRPETSVPTAERGDGSDDNVLLTEKTYLLEADETISYEYTHDDVLRTDINTMKPSASSSSSISKYSVINEKKLIIDKDLSTDDDDDDDMMCPTQPYDHNSPFKVVPQIPTHLTSTSVGPGRREDEFIDRVNSSTVCKGKGKGKARRSEFEFPVRRGSNDYTNNNNYKTDSTMVSVTESVRRKKRRSANNNIYCPTPKQQQQQSHIIKPTTTTTSTIDVKLKHSQSPQIRKNSSRTNDDDDGGLNFVTKKRKFDRFSSRQVGCSTSTGADNDSVVVVVVPTIRLAHRLSGANVTGKSSNSSTDTTLSNRSHRHKPYIMFTGITNPRMENIVKQLGGHISTDITTCTHLITDKIRRTVKFLCCLARGIPIVSCEWLDKCIRQNCFIDVNRYPVIDDGSEEKFNFNLQESIVKAKHTSLFRGYKIHVTKNVSPLPRDMKTIITCAGGEYLLRLPSKRQQTACVIAVTCEQDKNALIKSVNELVHIVTAEFVMIGILQQKFDLNTCSLR